MFLYPKKSLWNSNILFLFIFVFVLSLALYFCRKCKFTCLCRQRLSSKKWEMSRRKSLLHKFAQNCHCCRMLGFVSLVYDICYSKKISGSAVFPPKALWLFQRPSVNLEACLKSSKRHTFTNAKAPL